MMEILTIAMVVIQIEIHLHKVGSEQEVIKLHLTHVNTETVLMDGTKMMLTILLNVYLSEVMTMRPV